MSAHGNWRDALVRTLRFHQDLRADVICGVPGCGATGIVLTAAAPEAACHKCGLRYRLMPARIQVLVGRMRYDQEQEE